MSIEDIIAANTKAIEGLSAQLIRLEQALLAPVNETKSVTIKETVQVTNVKENIAEVIASPETAEVEFLEESVKDTKLKGTPVEVFTAAKALINKLALEHRDEIKALNAKHGLKVFADLLEDKTDVSKGVKDIVLLWAYYDDLLILDK